MELSAILVRAYIYMVYVKRDSTLKFKVASNYSASPESRSRPS